MKPIERRLAAKTGLRSVPVKRAIAKLAVEGVPAHINPREDRLLQRRLPESHGRVLVSGLLAELGRRGDDRVTLVNSREAKLLKKHGGSGARNPKSGLREYEDDKGDGNPGGGHNADGPASSGGYGGGYSGPSSSPGDGTSYGGGTSYGPARDVGYSWGNSPTGYRSPDMPDSTGFQPENNPELGGGVARGRGLASVHALGPVGRNVNAASSVMAGKDPSLSDRGLDFVGWGAPGGVPGSRAANLASTIAGAMLGGAVGGPFGASIGASLASLAHNTTVGGRSLADTVPGMVGGYLGGGLGSLAASTVADAIRGKESYDAPMTEKDRERKDAQLDAEARGERRPGSASGSSDGVGAGVAYLKEPTVAPVPVAAPAPIPASNAPPPASAARDGWDEQGFLTRNPEVARAVQDGVWASGRAFNAAYKTQAGANYDSAKVLGLISPYTGDLLKTRSGQALPYRG